MSDRQRISTFLVYRAETGIERVLIWDTVDVTVGRSKSQDIVVGEPEVSRQHARFWREGECCRVKDLGSAIGTLVNGEAISEHELRSGDLVQVGSFEIKFGQTTRVIRPGENVRFASELKAGLKLPSGAGAGGRTMLEFDAGDSLLFASEPTLESVASGARRELAADGSLAEAHDEDPLGLSIDHSALVGSSAVRNLDDELCLTPPEQASSSPRFQVTLDLESLPAELASALSGLAGKSVELPLRIYFRGRGRADG